MTRIIRAFNLIPFAATADHVDPDNSLEKISHPSLYYYCSDPFSACATNCKLAKMQRKAMQT